MSEIWPGGKPAARDDGDRLSELERRLEARVAVVLVRAQHAGNVGRLARFMHNMGVSELRLVDPFAKDRDEAVKAAVHARDVAVRALDRPFADLPGALADRELVIGTFHAGSRATAGDVLDARETGERVARLLAEDPAPSVALVLGSEKWGLSSGDLARCHFFAQVPARPGNPSLNVAHAALVLLYEIRRACLAHDSASAKGREARSPERATQEDVDRAADALGRVAEKVKLGRERRDVEDLARALLLGRAAGRDEARVLAALFAKIARALER